MKPVAIVMGLALLGFALVTAWQAEPVLSSSQERDGKKIFVDSGCQTCHSVSATGLEAKTTSDKLKGPDLVDVGKRHEPEWIAKYLKKEADMDGKAHRIKFKGSDEELMALVDWLLKQKAE